MNYEQRFMAALQGGGGEEVVGSGVSLQWGKDVVLNSACSNFQTPVSCPRRWKREKGNVRVAGIFDDAYSLPGATHYEDGMDVRK